MIGFIYPKDDWTAAEIAIKMQALAASQGKKVYSPPKNTRRNKKEIEIMLSRIKHAIFLAYDNKNIDDDTKWELEVLKNHGADIYFVVPKDMIPALKSLGIQDNIYSYEAGDHKALIQTLERITDDLKKREGVADIGEALVLLAILGMLIFFLWLLFEKE